MSAKRRAAPWATDVSSTLEQALQPLINPGIALQGRLLLGFPPSGVKLSDEHAVAVGREPMLGGPDTHRALASQLLREYALPQDEDSPAHAAAYRLLMAAGDTTSYCPFPTQLPIWVVTTTWPRAVLALVAAAIAGAGAGVAAEGPDVHAAIVGAIGAEAGVLMNLLAYYLTAGKRGSDHLEHVVTEYLYRPEHLGTVLYLRAHDATAATIAHHLGLRPSRIRRVLQDLERDGVVARRAKVAHGAWLWSLTRSNSPPSKNSQ